MSAAMDGFGTRYVYMIGFILYVYRLYLLLLLYLFNLLYYKCLIETSNLKTAHRRMG